MDEIVFEVGDNPATITLTGESNGPLTAGTSLKIETSPQGDDILNVEVPAGKVWQVRVQVFIVETDA